MIDRLGKKLAATALCAALLSISAGVEPYAAVAASFSPSDHSVINQAWAERINSRLLANPAELNRFSGQISNGVNVSEILAVLRDNNPLKSQNQASLHLLFERLASVDPGSDNQKIIDVLSSVVARLRDEADRDIARARQNQGRASWLALGESLEHHERQTLLLRPDQRLDVKIARAKALVYAETGAWDNPESPIVAVLRPIDVMSSGETRLGRLKAGVQRHTPAGLKNAANNFEARLIAPAKSGKSWIKEIVPLVGLFLALDWGSKYLFYAMHWPYRFHEMPGVRVGITIACIPLLLISASYYLYLIHAKEPTLQFLTRLRQRRPIVGGIFYGLLTALTVPIGLRPRNFAGDLAEKYPVVRILQRYLTLTCAAMAAGSLGNGLESVFNHKVMDFIWFGHSRFNLTDAYLFMGLPFTWLGMEFCKYARIAHETGQPIVVKTWWFYLWPIVGTVIFLMSTYKGYDEIPLWGVYFQLYSTLFLIGISTAHFIIERFATAFNSALPTRK